MSIVFPTTLDTLSNPASTDLVKNSNPLLAHARQHADANDAIEALEAKVGINSSLVATSHDYKIAALETITSEVTGGDKAVGKSATQTLTNKTIVAGNNTITGITEAMQTLADNTTLDVSTSKHGYVPKAPNVTTKFLRADGTWAFAPVLSSTGSGSANIASDQSITIAHGLASTPSFVRFTFTTDGTGGTASITTITYKGGQSGVVVAIEAGTNTGVFASNLSRVIASITGGQTYTTITVVAPDATNIAFSTVKSNGPTGTYYYVWEAFV